MTRKILQFAAIFVVGVVFGGLSVKLTDHSREAQRLFANKLKCQSIAAKYAQEHDTLSVTRVDYSIGRSSCIAEMSTSDFNSQLLEITDVATSQTLSLIGCPLGDSDCYLQAQEVADKSFERVLVNANYDPKKDSIPFNLKHNRSH